MTASAAHAHGAPPPAAPEVSAGRLLLTLGVAGALAGLLIVVVYQLTQPTIARHKAVRLQLAVEEVLHEPARFDTLYLVEGALRDSAPAGRAPDDLVPVYVGYDGAGRVVGFAVVAAQPGFADVVRLIFGYDPASGQLLGLKVLESKETPGLGDRIESDTTFRGQFAGLLTPLRGVNAGKATGDPHEVDMLTGATISSRAVIRIVNDALAQVQPGIAAWMRRDGAR